MIDVALPDPLPAPGAADYWSESRRPLVSLAFVTPILAAYELGVLIEGLAAARNGADAWLRALLEAAGLGQYFLLPVLTVAILLGWHHTTRQPWRVPRGTLAGMAVECAALAFCLWVVLLLQGALLRVAAPAASVPGPGRLGGLVGYLGAGVYEELLFRLMLLPAVALGVRSAGATRGASLAAAALTTSFIFAAAHHVGQYGEPLDAFTFLFRLLAGLFFSALFLARGFGIAAGTHAGYDILVGVVLSRAA